MELALGYFKFLSWLVNFTSFAVGIALGVAVMVAIPAVWRAWRRRDLRQRWKSDQPGHVEQGLYPEWQDYDPDMPGIASRCVCHRRRVHPGEHVMTWPETGPLNMLHVAVYCESVKEKLWLGL